MAIENQMLIPVNGTYQVFHPETSLQSISDMTAFIKTLSKAADAAAARTQLGVKELTPSNLFEALHTYGDNYVPTDTSNTGWNSLGVCSIYYTENMIANQPTQYGQLINIPATDYESTQLWISQVDGRIYGRKGNGETPIDSQPFMATSGSGIIAQSLAQNGWVKFDNGLIMQWGDGYGRNWTNFPIAYPTFCSLIIWQGLVSSTSNPYKYSGVVKSKTANGFQPYMDDRNDKIIWFALGW